MATNDNTADAGQFTAQFGKDPKEMSKDEFVQLLKDIKDGKVAQSAEITEIGNRSDLQPGDAIAFLPAPDNGNA